MCVAHLQRQRGKRREREERRASGGEENGREPGNPEKLKQRKKKKSAGVKVGCKEFVQNNMSSFSHTHKQQAGWFGSFHGKVASLDLRSSGFLN